MKRRRWLSGWGGMRAGALLLPLVAAGCLPSVAPTSPGALSSRGAAGMPSTVVWGGEASEDDQLALLVLNLRRRYRPDELDVIVDHLRESLPEMPDFILCQEVSYRLDGPDGAADPLANRLDMHARATKRVRDGEGLGILSRYPFDHYDSIEFGANTNRMMMGNKRIAVLGEFVVPEIGRVRVVNTHLAHWGWEGHIREQQLRQTLDWIARRDRQVPADITFFGGDFNSPRDGRALTVIDETGVGGHLEYSDWNTDVYTLGAQTPRKRVDYIFVAAPDRAVEMVSEVVIQQALMRGVKDAGSIWFADHRPMMQLYAVGPGQARSEPAAETDPEPEGVALPNLPLAP